MKNILWTKFLTLYYLVFYPKIYDSIHNTPAFIWEQVHKKADYSLLISKETKIPIGFLHINKTVKAWEKIYDEFIQEFPPEEYYKDLAIRKKIALYRYKAIAHNQRKYNTLAAIEEMKLKVKREKGSKGDFMKNIMLIEKQVNAKINYLKISIFEYNKYLTNLSQHNGI